MQADIAVEISNVSKTYFGARRVDALREVDLARSIPAAFPRSSGLQDAENRHF